jgi:formate-dependent nitrite reductase membrane component NrfD
MAKVVKRHPFQRNWRRDLLIAALISMLLAMALLLYTFGLPDDFILRLFNAFFFIFILLAGTALVIVPSINWAFMRSPKRDPK